VWRSNSIVSIQLLSFCQTIFFFKVDAREARIARPKAKALVIGGCSIFTVDFRSADSSVGLLISTTMYGSAHTTTIRNRPTNKFDRLPDCLQTKESGNYRPTANQYGALCAHAYLPILSADWLFRSEFERRLSSDFS
jgi:hypothetical protein